MDTPSESPNEKEEEVAATSATGRKYQTEAEARRGSETWWREESWPERLYKKLTVGRYFYRARTGPSRPFLQLETDDLKVARRRLRDKMSEVADLRASGQNGKRAEFTTCDGCSRRRWLWRSRCAWLELGLSVNRVVFPLGLRGAPGR